MILSSVIAKIKAGATIYLKVIFLTIFSIDLNASPFLVFYFHLFKPLLYANILFFSYISRASDFDYLNK